MWWIWHNTLLKVHIQVLLHMWYTTWYTLRQTRVLYERHEITRYTTFVLPYYEEHGLSCTKICHFSSPEEAPQRANYNHQLRFQKNISRNQSLSRMHGNTQRKKKIFCFNLPHSK